MAHAVTGISKRFSGSVLRDFAQSCLERVGSLPQQAKVCADVLVNADERGVSSHGLNRLDVYVQDLKTGAMNGTEEPKIVSETPAIACVDGCNAVGAYTADFCMKLAISKAQAMGVGWVVARGCNHYGIAGYYAMQALQSNMIGFCFTNTSPCVVPTRAAQPAIGTNPISCAAAGTGGETMVLDMATSTSALGRVEVHQRAGLPIGRNWGVDSEGRPTVDAQEVLFGGLCPLGGDEENAGYKGYGLAMMVEVITGVLAGAQYALRIKPWRQGRTAADLGQCFIAVDPAKFCPGFEARMSDLMTIMRGLRLAPDQTEVLIPGDPELRMQEQSDRLGVPLHVNVIEALDKIAEDLGLPLLSLSALPATAEQ